MKIDSQHFVQNARLALDNQKLQGALSRFSDRFPKLRQSACEGLPEFRELTDIARDIKARTLENLDFYLETFEARVTAAGGVVHWARDAAEACSIVGRICLERGARLVIKSKSMVTEEIELNDALEDDGLRIVETDLGEYIIQLRAEPPSHILAPAIHLTKEDVAETFEGHHRDIKRGLGEVQRRQLVEEARLVLRQEFLNADVGITGANFLVAETGSVVLVTNEGNADLAASLPGTHIAITGIEKVVPTLENATTMLRLLARSATGQEFGTYTTFFTGPKRADDSSGPDSFHVVLLDNGRSAMLGTEFHDMLRCIRCSACLNHCPVYHATGGHAYGSNYSGPMGAVLTPSLAGIEKTAHLPNASSFCGRCEEVCPVQIPLPMLMRHWREREFERHLAPSAMRYGLRAWARIARYPGLYRWVLRRAAGFLRSRARSSSKNGVGWIDRLPGIAGGWTRYRDMRAPASKTFQAQWRSRSKKT